MDELREKHRFTNQRIAQPQNWAHFSAGMMGIRYGVTFSINGLRTELYIDANDGALNRAIFDALAVDRPSIEQELGFALSWEAIGQEKSMPHFDLLGGGIAHRGQPRANAHVDRRNAAEISFVIRPKAAPSDRDGGTD